MTTFFIAYLLCGIAIGFLAGLFGIGGGIIGIPILFFLFTLQGVPESLSMHMAVGTLFATIIVTSIVTIRVHYRNGTIVVPLLKRILLGTIVGSAIGIFIATHLHGLYLQRLFGLCLILIALQKQFDNEIDSVRELPTTRKLFLTTTFLGTLSGMLGLGGGILMVPYLNAHGIPIRNAIATAAACILPAAIVGTIGYMISSVQSDNVMFYHSGFIYWPAFLGISITTVLFAPLGVRVTQRISPLMLKKIFSIFLFIIGLIMLLHGKIKI